MRAFLAILWVALTLGTTTAFAQSAGQSGCDGTKVGECEVLAVYYKQSIHPFPKDPDRAQRLLDTAVAGGKAACRAGDFPECFRWVNLVQRQARTSSAANPAEATLLLLQTTAQACAEGNADGCYWQAQGLRNMGDARPEKPTHEDLMAQAKSLAQSEADNLRPTCAAGDAQACGRLGILINSYDLPEITPHEHLDFLTRGCTAGSDDACYTLGSAIGGFIPITPSKTADTPIKADIIANLETLCDEGQGQICTLLATRILKPKDASAFLAYASKACDGGDAIGCSGYGMTQLDQHREAPNPATLTKATEALTKACELDALLACHALQHIGTE